MLPVKRANLLKQTDMSSLDSGGEKAHRIADDQIEAGKIKNTEMYQVNMKRYFYKKKKL